MNYELRALTSKDIFPMSKLISKFGIDEFKKCFDPKAIQGVIDENGTVKGDKLASLVGLNIVFDIASIVLNNLSKCENELYTFLVNISNLTREELETMSPAEFMQLIIDVIQKEEFKDFFGVVSKLLK